MTLDDVATRDYGAKIAAVEPGGAEAIPDAERHGRPSQLLWTWSSPNLEFSTIFVGVLPVLYFRLDLPSAIAAALLGNLLGAVAHGGLSTIGPRTGLGQMAFGRRAFGRSGNVLPGVLNASLAGVGWFAVNSISGAFALSGLLGLPLLLSVFASAGISLVLAFFGHNLIQLFERVAFPLLAVVFLVGVAVVLPQAHPSSGHPIPGAFLLAVSTSFGYAIAWAPLASDYSRYLRPGTARRAGLFAGVGLFVSTSLLEISGAAAVSAVGLEAWSPTNPTSSYTSLMPSWLGIVTLLAIWVGALSANALNLYSSGLTFAAIGVHPPTAFGRAAIVVAVGLLGTALAAAGLQNVSGYENFLLLVGYWTAPWLGVVLADLLLRPGIQPATFLRRDWNGPAGAIAMGAAMLISIGLFADQSLYVGPVAAAAPVLGDATLPVGFLIAFGLYALLRRRAGVAASTEGRTA